MSPKRVGSCAQASHDAAGPEPSRRGGRPEAMTTNHGPWSFIAVLAFALAACSMVAPAPSVEPRTGLVITAVAGPTCPVERIPPDPACAPRPVAGATVVVQDAQRNNVATVVLDAGGAAVVALPVGQYIVQPQPVVGLMGTAASTDVAVLDGPLTPVVLSYDTGIR